jgi:clan AA aspartic protease
VIRGAVNARYEATIAVTIHGTMGQAREIEAIVDTGFNGALTLPPRVIAELGLPWHSQSLVMLANGAEEICDVYVASLTWDGQPRPVRVEAAETSPLLGMRLLSGYAVHIDVLPSGAVLIEGLS